MTKPANKTIDITLNLSEAMAMTKIDREKGVIEGVLILTGDKVSRNKTFYTKKALQEAVTRYEGAKMYLDHPKAGETVRSVRDYGGTYKNVRLEEGNRLKADLHLIQSEQVRSTVIPIAESKPAGAGLSIRDRGHGREEKGVFLVEGFAGNAPFSIDLVMEASVNETLFESTQGGDDMDLKTLTLEQLTEGNLALVESIRSTERTTILKELEEKIKAGEDAPKLQARARKMIALAESGLPTDVMAKIKPVVEADTTSPEAAEAMVKAQKEILEAMKPAPKTGKEPKVTGHGASKETQLSEEELPSEDELARAIVG